MKIAALIVVAVLQFGICAHAYGMNSTAATCDVKGSCVASGAEGNCVSKSSGCCDGGFTDNVCGEYSSDIDIQCCTYATCVAPAGAGTCMNTALCTAGDGVAYDGYCVGSADMQSC